MVGFVLDCFWGGKKEGKRLVGWVGFVWGGEGRGR